MPLEKKFNIGDKVITIGYAYYEKNVPFGEIGTDMQKLLSNKKFKDMDLKNIDFKNYTL